MDKIDLTFVLWLKKRGEELLDNLVKKYVMELPPAPAGERGAMGAKGDKGDPGKSAVFTGDYIQGNTYEPGEVVFYRGSSWTPKRKTNKSPTDKQDWQLVASRGINGINGKPADVQPLIDAHAADSNDPHSAAGYVTDTELTNSLANYLPKSFSDNQTIDGNGYTLTINSETKPEGIAVGSALAGGFFSGGVELLRYDNGIRSYKRSTFTKTSDAETLFSSPGIFANRQVFWHDPNDLPATTFVAGGLASALGVLNYPFIPTGQNVTNNSTSLSRGISVTSYRNAINEVDAEGRSDSGTLGWLYGIQCLYGNTNANASATPITSTVSGLTLYPRQSTGSITLLYDIYVGSLTPTAVTTHWSFFQHSGNRGNNTFSAYSTSRTLIGTQTDNGVDKLQVAGTISTTGGVKYPDGKTQLVSTEPAFVHAWTSTGTQTVAVTANTPVRISQMNTKGPERGVTFDTTTGILTVNTAGAGHFFVDFGLSISSSVTNTLIKIVGYKVGTPDISQHSMGEPYTKLPSAGDPYNLAMPGCFTAVANDQYYYAIISDKTATLTIHYCGVKYRREYIM